MRVFVLVVCLAACNQVYGLDPTIVVDALEIDTDGDAISDARDNCPKLANKDQHDEDEDGQGDLCDPCAYCMACATGPEHDEDGDRFADGCDNCPAVANDQTNADGDDLGDACDPSAEIHRRVFFDGFQTLASEWLPTGGAWDVVGDAVGPAVAQDGVRYGLGHVSVRVPPGTAWFIEVGIVTPPVTEQGIEIPSGLSVARCVIEPVASGYRLNNTGIVDQNQFPFPSPARLRFVAVGSPNTQSPDCQLVGVASRAQFVVYDLSSPLSFLLVVTGGGRFGYVDVIGP